MLKSEKMGVFVHLQGKKSYLYYTVARIFYISLVSNFMNRYTLPRCP